MRKIKMEFNKRIINFLSIVRESNGRLELEDLSVLRNPKNDWDVYYRDMYLMMVDKDLLLEEDLIKKKNEHVTI